MEPFEVQFEREGRLVKAVVFTTEALAFDNAAFDTWFRQIAGPVVVLVVHHTAKR